MKDEETPVLEICRISIVLRFRSAGLISHFWGPTFRGGFGLALKECVCSFSNIACEKCAFQDSCAYNYLFETPVPQNSAIMRLYPKAPHPFVMEPPTDIAAKVDEGDTASFGMVLLGKAILYLPYVILGLDRLGKKGLGKDAVIFEVVCVKDEEGTTIYKNERGFPLLVPKPKVFEIKTGTQRQSRFRIKFETPLRLQVNGKIQTKFSFADVFLNLMRRIQLVSYFHTTHNNCFLKPKLEISPDDVALVASSLRWFDKSRWSTRQQRKVPIGGLVGDLIFAGELGYFLPLLKVGEYIHIGKNSTFGLGKIKIMEE